jgi:hypothetical protein
MPVHHDIELYAEVAKARIGPSIIALMQKGMTNKHCVRVSVAVFRPDAFPQDPGQVIYETWIYPQGADLSTYDLMKYALYARTKAMIAGIYGMSSRAVRDELGKTEFYGVTVWAGSVVVTLTDGWRLAVGISGDSEDQDEKWATDWLKDILISLREVVRL